MWPGTVVKKNWTLSTEQCRAQALMFTEHFIDFFIISFCRDGSVWIQKIVVHETG